MDIITFDLVQRFSSEFPQMFISISLALEVPAKEVVVLVIVVTVVVVVSSGGPICPSVQYPFESDASPFLSHWIFGRVSSKFFLRNCLILQDANQVKNPPDIRKLILVPRQDVTPIYFCR